MEHDHQITSEVWLESTPGHTPGHVSVRIKSQGSEAVITGDVMRHRIQCSEPDLHTTFDLDPEQARHNAQCVEIVTDRLGDFALGFRA